MQLWDSHLGYDGTPLIDFKRVLIATDFSDGARKALRYAAAIARKYNARLYVVHVLSSIGYRMVGDDAEIQASELATRELKQLWNQFAGSNDRSESDIEVVLIVRQGDVLTEVQDLISKENIHLVVVGTHGRSGLPKVMLGSVAESIFRHVPY
jgi:nucleotide-binding universal stress UspA family protein